jgi:hypothetical protein
MQIGVFPQPEQNMGVCCTQLALDYDVSAFILTSPLTRVLEVASETHKTLVPYSWTRRRERENT